MSNEDSSVLAYAGLGGVTACCLALELLGGAVILSGVAAMVGLSIGLTYVTVVGAVGILVVWGLSARLSPTRMRQPCLR